MSTTNQNSDPDQVQVQVQGRKVPGLTGPGQWKNRIVGYGVEAPDQILANPLNHRIHPEYQQEVLAGVLNEVGIVQNVIINKRTDTLIDGHLRVVLAMRNNQKEIPVTYVDLSKDEELEVLAILDAVGAMAQTDGAVFEQLLKEFTTTEPAIIQKLNDMATAAGLYLSEQPEPDMSDMELGDGAFNSQFSIIVFFKTAADQELALENLQDQGYKCKALS